MQKCLIQRVLTECCAPPLCGSADRRLPSRFVFAVSLQGLPGVGSGVAVKGDRGDPVSTTLDSFKQEESSSGCIPLTPAAELPASSRVFRGEGG